MPNKDEFLADSEAFNEAMAKLSKHLATNYYTDTREWHYKDIEPRIFAEEFLGDGDGKAPSDYKLHVMSDEISHIDMILDKFTDQKEIAMSPEWEKMPFDFEKRATYIPDKPECLELMKTCALTLAKPFKYVRVDLYEIDSRVYVGELTFTPCGGTDKFNPPEWDKKLGDLWV